MTALLPTGCNYGLSGGGGFPAHVQTLYVEPFENRTVQFDLEQQLFAQVIDRVPSALGVRLAGRDVADALIRGRITRYDDLTENYRATPDATRSDVLRRNVYIGMTIELVDLRNNVILWESQGLSGQGAYDPTNQTDQEGRRLAIDQIIQKIIEGAQSQW